MTAISRLVARAVAVMVFNDVKIPLCLGTNAVGASRVVSSTILAIRKSLIPPSPFLPVNGAAASSRPGRVSRAKRLASGEGPPRRVCVHKLFSRAFPARAQKNSRKHSKHQMPRDRERHCDLLSPLSITRKTHRNSHVSDVPILINECNRILKTDFNPSLNLL